MQEGFGVVDKGIFRCKDFWSERSTPWKQNTQKIIRIEWTREEKSLNLQILNVAQDWFTLLVFSITGDMGRECSMFVKRLCQMISRKRKEELSVVTCGIRCKISYAFLQSSLLYVRVSRKTSSEYVQLNTVTFSAIDLAKNNESLINIPIN